MKNEIYIDKTNEMLPAGKLFALGLQHVLTLYAGAIAIPLIIGAAVGLTQTQIAFLVAADLFASGLASIIQAYGIGNFVGIRLPVVLGCTFAVIGPMITIAHDTNLPTAYGSIMIAGIFVFLIAPLYGKLLRFFPPVVTGTILTVIGISLIPIGVNSMAGGQGVPDFGAPKYLLISFLTMGIIILTNKFFKGFYQSLSVLFGLIIGTIVASFFGLVDMTEVYKASWVGFVRPMAFGVPQFHLGSILMMCLIMIVSMIESTGTFIATSKLCGREITEKDIVRGMRAEGTATLLGGFFNSFPYTTYSQNMGLLALTKVTSRFVVVSAGIILMCLGLLPKFAALATIIPAPVFGGVTAVMVAMVAVAGMQTLQQVDFHQNSNMLIVACSMSLGIGISVAPNMLDYMPHIIKTIFSSGIVTASIIAVFLNIILNPGKTKSEETENPVGL